MELTLKRFVTPRPEPIPDSLTLSIDETARLQPRGPLSPLPPSFRDITHESPLEVAPSAAPAVSEILHKFRTQVHEQQLATDAGKAFLADHPETLQTFRLERPL